jgi:hypothetical protein
MSESGRSPWIDPAIRVATAGIGGAVAGPLGAALGGWLAGVVGEPVTKVAQQYIDKFGEKASEKLIEISGGSLAEKLKQAAPQLERAYRQALRLSLRDVHADVQPNEFDDWFTNWETCLTASMSLDLSSVEQSVKLGQNPDDLFRRAMERLDAQGAAIRQKNLSIDLACREMPETLLSELIRRLPGRLHATFQALIVTPEYEGQWKEVQLVFEQSAESALRRIEETTERIDRKTTEIAEGVGSVREQVSDLGRTISRQIAAQAAQKRRKTWRDLSHTFIPMIGGVSEKSNSFFISVMFRALELTFGDRAFTEFIGLLRYAERSVHDQTVPIYYLLCHEIEFCEAVRRMTERLLRSYSTARQQGQDAMSYIKQEEQKAVDAFNHQWTTQASFAISERWLPLQFVVDPAKNTMSIEEVPMSLDPLEYPSGISTTSESLRFLASFVNAEGTAIAGDVIWYKDNYSLLKVWVDLIDHGTIEIGRLRINAEDYEEWDYLNPRVDLEIKNFEKR